MPTERTKLIFVGLPSSGKSTFIAALWHVVQMGGLPNSLKLDKVIGNREYVEALHSSWLKCEPVSRTQSSSRQAITMKLKAVETTNITEVVFPDLAGEIYDEQWRERRWSQEYVDLVDETAGIALFIHADHKYKPAMITDYTPLVQESDTSEEQEATNLPEYNPDKACKQVKMVELLQFHVSQIAHAQPMKVAVIVSAWDVIETVNKVEQESNPFHLKITPELFIEREVPLLYQYLRANPETITSKIYGVSAQGGDLETDIDQLRREMKQANRIQVVFDEQDSHDITEPLKWLIQ